ncbi:MAG: matrixin family metalloprotease [Gemmatales bacterium]|nr:matrixin family metalloprotease [Gemmatales bacterium]MDW8385787.1 SdrD B-like domain-containing protein [Gemmatales bacterium]
MEYVAQRGDGTIVRKHSDRNPYTIGDETNLNPAFSSIPDTLTRLVDGTLPAVQNVQDGTLIEYAHIRYATVGIDSINYPAGKLVIEGQETPETPTTRTNDNEATAKVVLPWYLTDHRATRYGARSFRVNDNNYDLDFFRLVNTRDLTTGDPITTDPIPIHVDIDRTGVVPNPLRQYNIWVFNAFNQLVYFNGPNNGFGISGNATNFLGPINEIPGDVPADFSSAPFPQSNWDAEYVVITPVRVVPRVLIPDTMGGRLAQGQFFDFLGIPGGDGFRVRFSDQNGIIDTPEFSDFMSLTGGAYFGEEGYEVEFRLPLLNSANTDIHFGQANDAIRLTGDPVTITESGVPVQYFPTGGMVYRNNLITNSAVAGIRLRDHTVDIPLVGQTLVTQSGRYFYRNRDTDAGTGAQRTNPNNYLPGANIYNNVIANNAGHGIQLVENNPLNPAIPAATGYHQIINNTIHNNAGNGIDLVTKGGPNVLNNIITKNNIGLRVQDIGYPGATVVANYNLFHQNSINIQGTTNGGNNIFNRDPLYVDADRLDLRVYARPGTTNTSPAVDAALSNLSDRLFAMRDPDVPTRAPNDDFRNRRRNDNPAISNTGAGQFPFYDIGAYETNEEPLRVLSLSLFTANGIVAGPVAGFTVTFAGRVDPATVNSLTVRVRLGTVIQPIGTISNSYDPVRDIHTFTFTFTNPLGAGNYTIFMDGTSTSTADPAIRDVAGQLLDGEFPPPATAPNYSFPSGNNVPGGDFNYAFTVVVSSLGDLVWNDLNGDGIRQGTEPGLSNVTVQLRTPGPDGIPGTADDVLIASTVTNASGNYGFTNLTPGVYIVDVLNSTLPPNFANTNPPRPKIITLGVGEARMDVDFGFRQDLQNARIGDLVWNDLNGDGIRQPGEPGIGGVKVDLVGSGPDLVLGTADDVTFPPQFTNAVGAYNFINLPAWTYRVTVDITSPPLAGFGLTTGNNPLTVTLSPGQSFLAADFGFVLRNSSIGDLLWYDIDGDGIRQNDELGIPSATVFIDLNNNNSLDIGEPAATTDSNGNYTIPSLAPGTYKVMVDFSTLPSGYVPTTTHPLTVTLGPNQNRTDVDFGFQLDHEDAELGGRVFSDVFGDGSFDVPDSGLSGINILLTWAGRDGVFGTGDDQNFGPFTTGMTGLWNSPASLPSGTYQVLVQNPPTGHVQTTPGGNPRTITLGISQVRTDVDFGYQQRQASIGDRVWHDLDLDGVQVPWEPGLNGVLVRLRYAGPDGILDTADDVLYGPVTTSGDGNYTFTGLGAGLYRVTVDPNSPPLAGKGPTTPNPLLVPLSGGAPGDSIDTADFGWVSANGAIGDRVFNDLNGDGIQQAGEIGIAGVRVFLDLNNNGTFDSGTDVERITNAFGFYQFTGLLAGTYRVIVDTSTLPGGTTPTIPNPADVSIPLTTDEVRSNVDFGFQLPPGTPGGVFYFTLKGGNTLTNSDGTRLSVTDTDIVRLVIATDGSWTYSLYFRGSDFGLAPGTESIDAFTFLPDGDILLSIKGAFSVKRTYTAPRRGTGSNITGNGEDILRFRPTAADANGRITAGSYMDVTGTSTGLFFRGSRFGLSGSAENVDALATLADGRILISTKGVATVPGLANVQPQDIMAFNPVTNTWSLYFRGSNAFLSGSAENVTAIALSDPAAALPTIYLSTNGNFAVPGLSGQKRDVFGFMPTSLGPGTSGTYLPSLTLQGGSYGMSTNMAITGMWLGVAPGAFPATAQGHATLPESNVGNLRWFEPDGQINIWIDFGSGLLSAADAERIRDAITYLRTVSTQSGGPSLVEVTNASQADIRITMEPGSTLGGPGSGVLATTQLAYDLQPSGTLANGEPFRRLLGHEFGRLSQITLVSGWNWYVGADPSGITLDQYDLQSVVTHELGHALGLQENLVDSTSAMFESLAAGQIRRSLGNSDLAALSELYAEGASLGHSVPPSGPSGAPTFDDDGLVYTMVNPGAVPVAATTATGLSQRGKEAKKQLAAAKLQNRRDRAAVDALFSNGGSSMGRNGKAKKVNLDNDTFWKALTA